MANQVTHIKGTVVRTVVHASSGLKRPEELSMAFVSAFAPAVMAVAVALMLAGCFTAAALWAFFVVAVVSAVALSLIGRLAKSFRLRWPFIAAGIVLACAVLTLAVPSAREGFFSFANVFIARHNEVFGTYIGLFSSGSLVCGSLTFAVIFGVFVGLACWFLTRVRIAAVSLLVVVSLAVFALHMSLGYAGGGAVLGIGAWLIQCRFTQLKNASYSVLHLAGIASGLLTLSFGLFAVCWLLYSPNQAVDNAYAQLEKAKFELRYGSDSLPQGNLAQAPAMNDGDSDCLELSVDGRVSDDLLLRGFVGANFDGESWEPLPYTAYEGEWKGVVDWMGEKGLVPVEQRAAFDDQRAAQGSNAVPTTKVTVNAKNADTRYMFLPYTLRELNSGAALNLDGLVPSGFIGEREYGFTMDDVATDDVLADASWLQGSSSGYASAENVFAAFAKENYLDVSDEDAAAVREYIFNPETWDEEAAISDYSIISRVRTMLDTLASYTEDAEAPANDLPFTEWFLGRAHEGNSAYFATVATIAFRSQGIPARYVEGYRADASDISYANAAGEPVVLGAHDAHAWVEVYLDGIGWTPIEVTPGFYNQSLNVDSVIDVGEAWSNGSQDVAMQGESVAGSMDEDEQQTPIALPILPMLGAAAIVVLGLAAVLVVTLFNMRLIRRYRRKIAIESEDQAICVPASYRYFARIMKASGCGFDRERPLDCLDRFAVTFPSIDVLEYKRAVELHQAYAFGGHTLKPNELRTVRRFNERLLENLPAPKTALGHAKRYFIEAL